MLARNSNRCTCMGWQPVAGMLVSLAVDSMIVPADLFSFKGMEWLRNRIKVRCEVCINLGSLTFTLVVVDLRHRLGLWYGLLCRLILILSVLLLKLL